MKPRLVFSNSHLCLHALVADVEMALGPERWAAELKDPLPPWDVGEEGDEFELEEGDEFEFEEAEEEAEAQPQRSGRRRT